MKQAIAIIIQHKKEAFESLPPRSCPAESGTRTEKLHFKPPSGPTFLWVTILRRFRSSRYRETTKLNLEAVCVPPAGSYYC